MPDTVRSDRGTVKRVYCCGSGGWCNGFKGELDTYMCHCECHTRPAGEAS